MGGSERKIIQRKEWEECHFKTLGMQCTSSGKLTPDKCPEVSPQRWEKNSKHHIFQSPC